MKYYKKKKINLQKKLLANCYYGFWYGYIWTNSNKLLKYQTKKQISKH